VAIPYGCAKQRSSPDAQKKPPFSRRLSYLPNKFDDHTAIGLTAGGMGGDVLDLSAL
jgi:hypothetical protein